jgi:hypothetical protein
MIREQQTTHVCVATAADGLLVTHRTTTSTNDADGTAAHSDLGALGRVKGDLQCVCDRGQRRTGVLFGGQKRPRIRLKELHTSYVVSQHETVPVSHCAPELQVLLSRADRVGTALVPTTNARRETRGRERANMFVWVKTKNE